MERTRKVEKETQHLKLCQQLEHLEQDWDSFKKSNPRVLPRSSRETSVLENSPRLLMHSLQHKSPFGGEWRVRTNDYAMEEIRRERREAIESGKLKGRRLLELLEEAVSEVGFGGEEEICSVFSDLVQESEVRSVSSYFSEEKQRTPVCCQSSSASSSVCEDKLVAELRELTQGEKKEAGNVEKREVVNWGLRRNGGRWMGVMGWLAFGFMVFMLGIVSVKSFGGHSCEEVILVPT